LTGRFADLRWREALANESEESHTLPAWVGNVDAFSLSRGQCISVSRMHSSRSTQIGVRIDDNTSIVPPKRNSAASLRMLLWTRLGSDSEWRLGQQAAAILLCPRREQHPHPPLSRRQSTLDVLALKTASSLQGGVPPSASSVGKA